MSKRFDSPSYELERNPYREPCPCCGTSNLAANDGCSYLVDQDDEQLEVITFHCSYCGNDYGVIQ